VIAGCLLVAGCQSHEGAAREEFARQYSCPADRVTVKRRADIRWSTVMWEDPSEEPPEEVAKDPERLAKWRADQKEMYAPLIASLDEYEVFEADGCKHTMLVGCKRPAKSADGKPRCTVAKEPSG
jgi:hypothetical protein